jgi:hypothetical protein
MRRQRRGRGEDKRRQEKRKLEIITVVLSVGVEGARDRNIR